MRVSASCVLRIAFQLLPAFLLAQERDLTSLSLEDFLNVEVTSVSKTPQKLSRTAAAVYVISQDDIRRSGAVSLPEALRLAPGVTVARIAGTTWAIGIRGFNSIYSNKLLVMVDGRTIYSALVSGVLWTDQLMMLEDIERIEVIRGPGGTMWGANAVSGVINIITKHTKDTLGGIASFRGGNLDPATGTVRYGGKFADNATWRAWSQYSLQGETTHANTAVVLDRWSTGRGGMRVDWKLGEQDTLLLEGEMEKNSSQVPALEIGALGQEGIVRRETGSSVGFIMGRWNHTTEDGNELAVQSYFSDNRLNGGAFTASVRTFDLDTHYSYSLTDRHTLMAGGGMRADQIGTTGSPIFSFAPASTTYYIYNGFLQDEWELVQEKLTATIGAKVEHYTHAGMTFQPTVRLMWTPTTKQGYWLAASQAIRTPSHIDYASHVEIPTGKVGGAQTEIVLNGSQAFKPEVLKALEVGTRWMLGRKLALDVAMYRHWYQRLANYQLAVNDSKVSLLPGTSGVLIAIPASVANGMTGINQGGEASLHLDLTPHLQLTGSYSSLFSQSSNRPGVDPNTSFTISSYTPKHQWQMRGSWDFRKGWTSELAFYRIGSIPGSDLPGYSRMDFRIARKLGGLAELSLGGQNLLRPRQQEFAGNILYPPGAISRSVELGVRWNFR